MVVTVRRRVEGRESRSAEAGEGAEEEAGGGRGKGGSG
jgi:hypothetical protein